MWELWGVEISPIPLKGHIAYTTACCYRTSREIRFSCVLSYQCLLFSDVLGRESSLLKLIHKTPKILMEISKDLLLTWINLGNGA